MATSEDFSGEFGPLTGSLCPESSAVTRPSMFFGMASPKRETRSPAMRLASLEVSPASLALRDRLRSALRWSWSSRWSAISASVTGRTSMPFSAASSMSARNASRISWECFPGSLISISSSSNPSSQSIQYLRISLIFPTSRSRPERRRADAGRTHTSGSSSSPSGTTPVFSWSTGTATASRGVVRSRTWKLSVLSMSSTSRGVFRTRSSSCDSAFALVAATFSSSSCPSRTI
mmetsp:Transcript_31133/g.73929  ORF Transcript_31133/g.73929 Transcript_31133/m.73929 type:complete len:233 (+) Transcript_31133:1143-1841(+)